MAIAAVSLLGACAVLSGLSALSLGNTQDAIDPADAAQIQAQGGQLYGPLSRDGVFAYKQERYRQLRPEILIVGSDRVAAFSGGSLHGPDL